ncbi:MAG TPA: YraN family protein [Capsulimonadaceae bacterium]|nr:YraN family protein [Capsulimonadaceae bacterium]
MSHEKAPSPHKKAIGNRGELAALSFLSSQGFRVVDTNVRPLPGMARGEIDIVAWDEDILCFVEVKTRRASNAEPVEAVDLRKQRQLIALAEAYLARHELDNVACRFDVVAVLDSPRLPSPSMRLIRDAFQPR